MAVKLGKNTKTKGWQILKQGRTGTWKVIDYKETRKLAERAIKKYT